MIGASFVVTLAFDPVLQDRLERERRQHFPPERNIVPAHVSLFHHLPAEAGPEMRAILATACAGFAPMPATVTGVMSLGKGTAYRMQIDGRLHAMLASAWHGMLRAQDRQAWRPHVTIQNKVTADAARSLHAGLSAGFMPFGGHAVAVRIWHYLGGPWELVEEFGLVGRD